jgi:hypothetical protein
MHQSPAPRRAVILGASNVYRNLGMVALTARAAWGAPQELLIAAGHGRSYGMWNWVLGYSVPGILQCALWERLSEREAPTAALLTDVGNDLLYGVAPSEILSWVEECLARLRPICERITIAQLPIERVQALKASHFALFRRVLFPRSELTFADAIAGATCLNDGIAALAKKFSASLVAPKLEWYGIDPIHVRTRDASRAWHALLAPWSDAPQQVLARGSLIDWYRLRSRRTHVQRFLSRERRTEQPALVLRDGSSVSLY